jgi:peptide deformylase
MRDLPIELLGSPFLRQTALPVDTFDEALRKLVLAMYRTMYRARGQGLAAPQVGVLQRIVVIDMPDEDSPPLTLINPRIVFASETTEKFEEGCLSIPGVTGMVERARAVTIEAQDENGRPFRIEASGSLADCVQHEVDHLDGVLYIDRMSALRRQLVLRRYERLVRQQRARGSA